MQFKVQNNAAQCNAVLLQCNTCSRLKTSVNSVHLGPGGHFFQGGAQAARLKGCKDSGTCRGLCRMQEGECVFCREASSAGGEFEERICVSSAGDFACRAADIKHLSAGSLPGTPVGRAVVLKTQNFNSFSPLFSLFTKYQIWLKKSIMDLGFKI